MTASELKLNQRILSVISISSQGYVFWRLLIVLVTVGLSLSTIAWPHENAEDSWPREIAASEGVVVLYQPQPEKLDGNQLKGRAAVSVELKESTEPVFGAVWFNARLDTDRAERTAPLRISRSPRYVFPTRTNRKEKSCKRCWKKRSLNGSCRSLLIV